MTQDNKTKFAAILAAQQAKVSNIKPLDKVTAKNADVLPTVINTDTDNIISSYPLPLAKLVSFMIIWHEGSGANDGTAVTTWKEANRIMTNIYNEHEGLGYLKVKICVKWDNGKEFTDRADCSDSSGDFCPKRETIGAYLKKQSSVMYASNLQQGDRTILSFEDAEPYEAFTAEEQQIIDAVVLPELSNITIEDLLNDKPVYCSPVTFDIPNKKEVKQQPKIEIVDYSQKAFAVIGDTKPIKDLLFSLGGSFNRFLKCGEGWIFSKRHLSNVKQQLAL